MKTIEAILSDFTRLLVSYTCKDVETSLDSFNIAETLATYPLLAKTSTQQECVDRSKVLDTNITLTSEQYEYFQQLRQRFRAIIQKDESKDVELNAKIRRKLKRLEEVVLEVIHKNPQHARLIETKVGQSAKLSNAEDFEVINDDTGITADKNLIALIEKVQTSATAEELEAALAPVKPGIGNTFSRRKLKRLIEQLVVKTEIEGTMNARIRRRITRVIKILSPTDGSSAEVDHGSNTNNNTLSLKQSNSMDEKGVKAGKKRKLAVIAVNVPHIVFVGQLPYSCNQDDLRQFFQQHQITGDLKIRLLTDAKTKAFRGMAFVEFSTMDDLNKALLLHHSAFMNRKINIEKSCGGKDLKKRKEMIHEQKLKQQRTIELTFQQLFSDYEQKGVLNPSTLGSEFKNKLISYSPLLLSKALEKFEKLSPKERKLSKLDQLFTQQIVHMKAREEDAEEEKERGIAEHE